MKLGEESKERSKSNVNIKSNGGYCQKQHTYIAVPPLYAILILHTVRRKQRDVKGIANEWKKEKRNPFLCPSSKNIKDRAGKGRELSRSTNNERHTCIYRLIMTRPHNNVILKPLQKQVENRRHATAYVWLVKNRLS